MEKLLKSILYEIAEKTYNKKPKNFEVKIIPEERKTFHGQYWPDQKRIEIFNLSRPTEYVISTSIHELAHHIAYSEYGDISHNKLFYKTFKELLETSIKLGYVNYDSIRIKQDSLDIQQMEKYFGKITVKYDPSLDSNKDYSLFKIINSYDIKDELKKMKYFYNSTEKIWQKKIKNSDIESEKEKITKLNSNVKFQVTSFNNLDIKVFYYIIIVGDTYDCKDELKQLGYLFNGYNQKSNKWIKKIEAKEIDKESSELSKLNLKYKIKTNLYSKKHG